MDLLGFSGSRVKKLCIDDAGYRMRKKFLTLFQLFKILS